jgi:hypothetical protein
MKRPVLHAITAVTCASALMASALAASPAQFTADGKLQPPDGYREWIYLSSGIDMSYRQGLSMPGHSMFDNVFVDPVAYRAFVATGTWPDQTMLVMEVRGAESKGSINHTGHFQTSERMGLEVHVKDTQRFDGGWGFFAFDGGDAVTRIPPAAECYACHRQHAAVDTTFVQFYPTLIGIAQQHATLTAEYMAEKGGK